MSDNKEKDTNTKVVVNTNEPKLTMLEKVCLAVSAAAITALTAVTLYDRFR
jgi:cell division protein FtsL